MFRNYLKTAFRSLWKNRFFSAVNIAGLAVGLTCCLLISAYLYTELTYDRYPVNAKQIYRVELGVAANGSTALYPDVDVAVGKGMKAALPGILDYTRLLTQGQRPLFIRYQDKEFKESNLAIVDANFFKLFTMPFVAGDPATALQQPNSVVVTRAFAERYFGTENPIGKTLTYRDTNVLKVTGMIEEVPARSHFHFDAFMSMNTYPWSQTGTTWSNLGFYTYLLLDKNTNPKSLEAKFPQIVAEHVVPEIQHDMGVSLAEAKKAVNTFRFSLMPLTRIHLYSHTKYELEPNGDIQYIYIFAALALFILLLACINFINLSTAGSFRRAKEIGIRKVLGSAKDQLIGQFITESILITCCAMVLAFAMVLLLLPYFNQVAGLHISGAGVLGWKAIVFTLLLTAFVGITAGIYPAFFLSSFKPVKVLKGTRSSSAKGKQGLRSGLVVFQFVVSITLIMATLIIYNQLHFMQNKKLGLDKNEVLIIADTYMLRHNEAAFSQQLLQNSEIKDVTISTAVPGIGEGQSDGTEAYAEGAEGGRNGSEIHINIFHVDYHYIPTLGMQVLNGRNFSRDFPTDSFAAVINQAAVNAFGWSHTDPLGKYFVRSGRQRIKVIGVVKDFNYSSVKYAVAPLVMMLGRNSGTMMVKIKTTNVPGLLLDIKKDWDSFSPGAPFTYSFLDAKYGALYQSERRTSQLFFVFSIIAIIIACLGLFGLVTFTAYQRTKEIGIRKVVGASVPGIIVLLSRDFLKLLVLSVFIAIPLTWLGMHQWLQNFAYRENIRWWVFALAGGLAIIIAMITISFRAIRAAIANPVEALRSE